MMGMGTSLHCWEIGGEIACRRFVMKMCWLVSAVLGAGAIFAASIKSCSFRLFQIRSSLLLLKIPIAASVCLQIGKIYFDGRNAKLTRVFFSWAVG